MAYYILLSSSNIINYCSAPIENATNELYLSNIRFKTILEIILEKLYNAQDNIKSIYMIFDNLDLANEKLNDLKFNDFFMDKLNVIKKSEKSDIFNGIEQILSENTIKNGDRLLYWNESGLLDDFSKLLSERHTYDFYCSSEQSKEIEYEIYSFKNLLAIKNIFDEQSENFCDNLDVEDLENLYEIKTNNKLVPLYDFGKIILIRNNEEYFSFIKYFIEEIEHSKYNISVNEDKQQLTKENKLEHNLDSKEIIKERKNISYSLYSEYEFLDKANEEQKIFLPELVESFNYYSGKYISSLTEEFIYGETLSSYFLNNSISKNEWKKIFDKIVTVIDDVFHMSNSDMTSDGFYNRPSEQIINDLREEYENEFNEFIEILEDYFSGQNEIYNNFYVPNEDISNWKKFFEIFLQNINLNKNDNIFFNGNSNRLVHGDLIFKNIMYNQQGKIVFLSPKYRIYELVDKNYDFSSLFLSCYCGYDAIKYNKFKTNYSTGKIIFSDIIVNNMLTATEILDSILKDDTIKMMAILKMLYMFNDSNFSKEQQEAFYFMSTNLMKNYIS